MPNTFSTDINVLGPHRVILHGTVDNVADVASVELIAGGTDLGSATINPDSSWTFSDTLDTAQFPVAVVTDGKGAKTTVDPKLELFPDQPQPSQVASVVVSGKSETIDVFGPGGRLLYDADVDVDSAKALITGHGPKVPFTAFVASGQTIANFHPGGPAHDSLDLSHTTLSGMSDLLHHTSMFQGSATIHADQMTTITLTGVTKGQIAHNPSDFTFAQPA